MRLLSGALVLLLFVALSGHAQSTDVPTGGGRISGRILTSTSEPVPGATVLLGFNDTGVPPGSRPWWVATSDPSGLYQFAGLPAGPFILLAAKDGYAGWGSIPTAVPAPIGAVRGVPALAFATRAPRLAIDLVAGGLASDVNLTLHRPASISGRAVRPDGSPAANEHVLLFTAGDTSAITSVRGFLPTDANGTYLFNDVLPGTYYLGFSQPGPLEDVDRSTLTAITVTEGASLSNVDVSIIPGTAFSVAGRVVDAMGQVPRMVQLEYGVPGATHRGWLSVSSPDGRFQIRDRQIVPGQLTIIGRGENHDGPVIGVLTLTTVDGPNDVEVIIGKFGGVRGRVSMEGGAPLTTVSVRLALVRDGFTPLGATDEVIEAAPDGWLEADDLIGDYRVRVDEPQGWTMKAVRRRGVRLPNDRLVIRNSEILDELEIVIGPR